MITAALTVVALFVTDLTVVALFVAVVWRPPCVRAIVTESDFLPLHSLHIITITGGSIGTGRSCTISIPAEDSHVSEVSPHTLLYLSQ